MRDMRRRYGRSRRDLAEAAILQFEQRGFSETTVDDIADAAGYSTRTFFRQFASKHDVVFFDLPDILDTLRALLRDPPGAAWDAVTSAFVKNSEEWAGNGPQLALSRTRLLHDEPVLYRHFLEISVQWEMLIAEIFAAERGRSAQDDAYSQVVAACIVGAGRAAMRQWAADPRIGFAERTAAALELVQSGFEQYQRDSSSTASPTAATARSSGQEFESSDL